MQLLNVILPIFLVIFLGYFLKSLQFINDSLVQALNRLVYHILLPVLIFWEISRSPFQESFNGWLIAASFIPMIIVFIFLLIWGRLLGVTPAGIGSLLQGSFRGNIAYVGLALAANIYGKPGLSKAGVLAGFMIPFMNFLSILGLLMFRSDPQKKFRLTTLIRSIFINSLILASFLGLIFSYYSFPIPAVLSNTLRLLSNLSLPLALLSMGGSLSFQAIKGGLGLATLGTGLKLAGLPWLGFLILHYWDIGGLDFKIAILLLSCPTAVVTYIMASELGGDPELSSSIIMLTTLWAMLTIPLWVWFVGV